MSDRTFVFELDLSKNENRNEFSYLELVKDRLGKRPSSDLLGDADSADLTEIAKQFEKKYGNMVTMNNKGKKRRLRVDDYKDLGAGYDSEDSFIDDSEYVELVVPPTVRTRFGGFFINSGILETVEDRVLNIETPPPPKQPKLDLSSKRPNIKKDKSKQLLERAVKQLSGPSASTSAASAVATAANNGGTNSLDAVFDSVISAGTLCAPPLPTSDSPRAQAAPVSQSGPPVSQQPAPTLPPLPDDLKAEVQKLLALKSISQGSSKSLISPQLEQALLQFDELFVQKNLTKSTRSGTYAYLADKLGMKTKALFGRLRKLKESQNGAALDPLLSRLRDAVKTAMVDIKAAHDRDMTYYQTRLSAWEREKVANPEAKRPGVPKKKFPFNADCRSYLEAIVTHYMESTFRETRSYPDQNQMKSFFSSLTSLWPDGWISIKALSNASRNIYENITNKANSNGPTAGAVPANSATDSSAASTARVLPAVPATTSVFRTTSSVATAAAMRAATQSTPTAIPSQNSPYVVQFASPTNRAVTAPKKEAPRVAVAPLIDLTEQSSSNGKQESPSSRASNANFSPPSITAKPSLLSGAVSGAVAAAPVPQRRIVVSGTPNSSLTSSSSPNRTSLSSVTVPMAQFLGRSNTNPAVVSSSSQQQQTTMTLQTVSNIISAFQQQQQQQAQAQTQASLQKQQHAQVNLQKQQQRLTAIHENVRYASSVPSIIINRASNQSAQVSNAANNSRIAHSASVVSTTPRVWGNTTSSSSTSAAYASSPSLVSNSNSAGMGNSHPASLPQIIRAQTLQRTPQQMQTQQQSQVQLQQQLQHQQQVRAAIAGIAKHPEAYLSWTRHFNITQDQPNETHRNSDRSGGK